MSLLTILLILLVLALLWGGVGAPRYWDGGGYGGAWSPLGLILLILLILFLTGNLHAQELAVSAAPLLAAGVSPPPITPNPANPGPVSDPHAGDTNYKQRWIISVVAWVVGLVLAIVKAVQELAPTLGISAQTANWLLVAGIILALIGAALQTFPTIPDRARLQVERTLHYQRAAMKMARR